MINPIYIRTLKEGDPRELMVNGVLSGQMTLPDLAAFARELLTGLELGKGKPVTVETPRGPLELTWQQAHELALSAASSMRWG